MSRAPQQGAPPIQAESFHQCPTEARPDQKNKPSSTNLWSLCRQEHQAHLASGHISSFQTQPRYPGSSHQWLAWTWYKLLLSKTAENTYDNDVAKTALQGFKEWLQDAATWTWITHTSSNSQLTEGVSEGFPPQCQQHCFWTTSVETELLYQEPTKWMWPIVRSRWISNLGLYSVWLRLCAEILMGLGMSFWILNTPAAWSTQPLGLFPSLLC